MLDNDKSVDGLGWDGGLLLGLIMRVSGRWEWVVFVLLLILDRDCMCECDDCCSFGAS